MSYRNEARSRLEAAENELASGDDMRLKYAALDLRMAMEALTYDRALAYKDEFPPAEYETWQPRRVMSVLLEIDAHADVDRALAFGQEQEYGVPTPVAQSLGKEKVLNMATLKKHYDALGSYLHLPSIKQLQAGSSLDMGRFRKRCEDLVALINEVLSSPIFNVTLGAFARFECFRCQRPIRRRLSRDADEIDTKCFECHATYIVKNVANGQVDIRPRREEVKCGADGCPGTGVFWEADLRVGKFWKCEVCQGRNTLVLGYVYESGAG